MDLLIQINEIVSGPIKDLLLKLSLGLPEVNLPQISLPARPENVSVEFSPEISPSSSFSNEFSPSSSFSNEFSPSHDKTPSSSFSNEFSPSHDKTRTAPSNFLNNLSLPGLPDINISAL
ncbi:hypothetical protein QYQ98_06155 [Corynebacterium sp. P3-F1]|uniref:hypothetical protein n=1 Tax=Corynebacterium sp. P3-F1 TaxID=3059080 RepID=UPI00265D54BE|nr:hypothetical protein [Corynebacterium sp. P3-F1]WKK60642.1 hypothetical protein QYQ98_06155 [Corynebacterium sp. P3-F1]